jgi:acetyl-CoA hydrolase
MREGLTLDAARLDMARYVRPGDIVAWGQCGAEPCTLTAALVAQRASVGGRFGVFIGGTWSENVGVESADVIDFCSYTGSGNNRKLVKAGLLEIIPSHYSQFESALKVDVLFLQVAPADENGCYSLSIAHEFLVPLIDTARVVIAEVNAAAPWTYGSRTLRANDFDVLVQSERAPLEWPRAQPGEIEARIAAHTAALIDDGMTLQFGMGALPEAILAVLGDRRDLGVHSGTIGDAVADLTERGVITNARKTVDRGVSVAGIMMGGKRVYRFAHLNAAVQFRPTSYTHDIDVLGRLDRFAAINSAIEVDLTGQVNAESAAGQYLGGVGGGVDFLRGAARSKGGLPIIALPSTTVKGSRIVAKLNGPVSTPRSDAGLIVTEHGVADLRGLTLRQRVRRMLDIAAPEWRETLEAEEHALI